MTSPRRVNEESDISTIRKIKYTEKKGDYLRDTQTYYLSNNEKRDLEINFIRPASHCNLKFEMRLDIKFLYPKALPYLVANRSFLVKTRYLPTAFLGMNLPQP